jgi:ribosome modulation factor
MADRASRQGMGAGLEKQMTAAELQYCSQAFQTGYAAGLEGHTSDAWDIECWYDRVSDKDRSEYWWGFHQAQKNKAKEQNGNGKNSQNNS